MALPLVPGVTQTIEDAEPLVYRLADVLERNPALMLADESKIMEVVGTIAKNRSTVQDNVNASLAALGRAWDKESDPLVIHEIAGWIKDIRGDEPDDDD